MTVDELQVLITANTDSLRSEIQNTQKELNSLKDGTSKISSSILGTFNMLKTAVLAIGIGKLIGSQMDDAISRLDTLNNFPRVMANLGISNEDAQASINRLQDALTGLPTTLDSASQGVQRLTSANGNIKASTEMFIAMNNAILAGGAPMEQQRSALEQLSQAYAKGKPDMMEWRSMMSAMPAQLNQVAIAMGYASSTALGDALRNGTVSMNDFMLKLTELNQVGANGFASFEEQARNATGGVATSIANVKTAFTRGLAEIMNAIGQSNIAGFFQGIARVINSVIPYIVAFIKLIGTAVSFVAGLFGKKLGKSVKSVNTSFGGVSTGANTASDGLNKMGNSGGKTAKGLNKATKSAKKLKKELKGLASFDEMNVLSDKKTDNPDANNSPSSGGGGSTGGGGGIGGGIGDLGGFDLSGFDKLNDKANKADEIYQRMMDKIKQLRDYLSTFDYSGIINHCKGIGQSVKDIFTDPKVVSSAQDYVKKVKQTLKTLINSSITIGLNVIEGFVGSIDLYLQQNKDRIKQYIIDMFKIKSDYLNYVGLFSKAIAEISSIFKSGDAKQIGANIIAIFANPIMSAAKLFGKFANDLYALLVMPIVNNATKIKTAMENTLKPIRIITDTLVEMLNHMGDSLNTLYDEHIAPFMRSLREGLSDTFGKFLDVYNTYIVPFLNNTAKEIKNLWDNHLKPLWDSLVELIGKVVDILKSFWENTLKPLIDWIITNVVPVLVPIFNSIRSTISTVISIIADLIRGLINVISGVITFVTGVFSGDWKKAWEGIKQVFSGVIDAVKSIFKSILEFFKGRFDDAVQVVSRVLTLIVNTVKNIFGKVVDIAKSIWNGIKTVFSVVGSWFSSIWTAMVNVVKGIFEKLKSIASNIWSGIKNVFNGIGSWFSSKWTAMVNTVKTIFNNIKTTASNIWSGIKTTFSNVGSWFHDKFQGAYNKIKGVFSGIGTFFGGIWTTIKGKFKDIGTKVGTAVGGAFKTAINGALKTIESILNAPITSINSLLTVINKVPGVNLSRLPSFSLPRLAKGGVIDKPTIAEIGEAGKEAVVPLENNTGWIDKLADRINGSTSSDGKPIQLIVKIGEDKIVNKLLDGINRKAFETGREVFNI